MDGLNAQLCEQSNKNLLNINIVFKSSENNPVENS